MKKIFMLIFLLEMPFLGAKDPIAFLANADMQLGNPNTTETKTGHVSSMIKLIEDKNLFIKALLIPGDLIEGIPDFKNISKTASKLAGSHQKDEIKKQFELFKQRWLFPLEEAFKKRWPEVSSPFIYLTAGNHDSYDLFLNTVLDFIRDRHGGKLYYSFDIEDLHFCCMSVCPDEPMNTWLKKDLELNKNKSTVIFFHYNLRGERSRWWSNNDIQDFSTTIQPYKNTIKVIIHGHNHSSYTTTFDGIPVIAIGGREYALCSYTPENKKLTTVFYKAVADKNNPGQHLPEKTIVPVLKEKDSSSFDDLKKTVERKWNWDLVRSH